MRPLPRKLCAFAFGFGLARPRRLADLQIPLLSQQASMNPKCFEGYAKLARDDTANQQIRAVAAGESR